MLVFEVRVAAAQHTNVDGPCTFGPKQRLSGVLCKRVTIGNAFVCGTVLRSIPVLCVDFQQLLNNVCTPQL
jgi:hypothetical protein